MPTTETIDGREVTVYSAQEKADGLTKARLFDGIESVRLGGQPWADDAAYAAHVCTAVGLAELPDYALHSYAEQHAARTIAQLEQALADAIEAAQDGGAEGLPTPTVGGVPTRVTKRQAKTLLELTPDATHGNLWQRALAVAGAIPDTQQRVVVTNYLVESQFYERDRVHQLAASLLGMTAEQVDQMLIAAAAI